MKSRIKSVLSVLGICVGALLLAVICYVLYVVFSYQRVEDNLPLTVAGEATDPVPVGRELTLTTFNIGFGAYSDDYSFFMDGGEYARAFSKDAVLENTQGALSAILSQTPDFALFQEVDVDGTRSYHVDQTALLAADFSGFDRVFGQNYDSPYLLYPFDSPFGANRSGVMTFSKYNITSSLRRSLPIEEDFYKFLDLDRAYTVSVIPTADGKEFILYNVHLSAYTSDGTIADQQMELLGQDMAAQYAKGNYVLAAGDFNKDMLGDSSQYFTREEGDFTWAKPLKNELLPQGITSYTGQNAPTCRNADSPFRGDGTDFILSVDGILVSDNVKILSCETVDLSFAHSDHNPVTVKFSLGKDQ